MIAITVLKLCHRAFLVIIQRHAPNVLATNISFKQQNASAALLLMRIARLALEEIAVPRVSLTRLTLREENAWPVHHLIKIVFTVSLKTAVWNACQKNISFRKPQDTVFFAAKRFKTVANANLLPSVLFVPTIATISTTIIALHAPSLTIIASNAKAKEFVLLAKKMCLMLTVENALLAI